MVRYKSFQYQASSWKIARRVVATVEFHCEEYSPGGLHRDDPGDGQPGGSAILQQARDGGQWIKAGKEAVKLTRLSCHRFRANEVRLWLSVSAYNLGILWRRLGLPTRIDTRSLTSLQQRLVKTDGRVVQHARYYWLAEWHLKRSLFGGDSTPADGAVGASGIAQALVCCSHLGQQGGCKGSVREIGWQCARAGRERSREDTNRFSRVAARRGPA